MFRFCIYMLLADLFDRYFVTLRGIFGLETRTSKYALKEPAEAPPRGIETANNNRFVIAIGMFQPSAGINQDTLGFLIILTIDGITPFGNVGVLWRWIKTENAIKILALEFVYMKRTAGKSMHAREVADPIANGSKRNVYGLMASRALNGRIQCGLNDILRRRKLRRGGAISGSHAPRQRR